MNILQSTLLINVTTLLTNDSMGDRLRHGAFNALIGLMTVFAILIICIIIISLFKYIPKIEAMFKGKSDKTESVVTEEIIVEEEDYTDDEELVAVIMAAIYACSKETEEIPLDQDALVVRSIRRVR